MSMICCEECERLIDSDDDPACFVDPPACTPLRFQKALVEVLCEPCRERAWEHWNERAMEEQS